MSLNSGKTVFSPIWTVGFMSGTSLDAVDAALILTDGEKVFEFGPVAERKYSDAERNVLARAVEAARHWNWSGIRPESEFEAARDVITRTHLDAFETILQQCDSKNQPELVGVHGQTVLHRAPDLERAGQTLQLARAQELQQKLGVSMVYDLRSDDVAAGGQGAPLAPIYHAALCRDFKKPLAVLNLGGVANLTFISDEHELLGFDCGPANGPIDEWVLGHKRGTYDPDGRFAAAGSVHENHLVQWLDHPYFGEALPKSLDRYDFSANIARGLSFEDGCATLTAFSAASVAAGLRLFPQSVDEVIVCGGGRHNPVLMTELRKRCSCRVSMAEDKGWRGDSIEAEAFAVLAVRSLRGLPISFPGTTGAGAPMTGGKLIKR